MDNLHESANNRPGFFRLLFGCITKCCTFEEPPSSSGEQFASNERDSVIHNRQPQRVAEPSSGKRFENNTSKVGARADLPSVHIVQNIHDDVDENDLEIIQSGEFYREQAQKYLQEKQQLNTKARQFKKGGNHYLAQHFFQLARLKAKACDQANKLAVEAFLAENRRRNPNENIIDFHHLYVKEAIPLLDEFLDDAIESSQSSVVVITGRGKHSTNGIPKIKLAVIKRLEDRKLKYTELNPGSLKVFICK